MALDLTLRHAFHAKARSASWAVLPVARDELPALGLIAALGHPVGGLAGAGPGDGRDSMAGPGSGGGQRSRRRFFLADRSSMAAARSRAR